MKQSTKDEIKVVKVINSCVTLEQLKMARKLIDNYEKLHNEGRIYWPLWDIQHDKFEKLILQGELK